MELVKYSKCKLVCSLVLLLFFIYTIIPINFIYADVNLHNPDIDIKATSALLIDLDRGQVLYERNADERIYDPILPKLMTSLIAIERAELNTKVTVSINAAEAMSAGVELEAGQQYFIEDLLAATILTSSQNTAIALAEFVNSDIDKFVESMNLKASTLNMHDTNFTNPHGKYTENQYTTARDIAIFLRHALSNDTFKSFFNSRTYYTRGMDKGFFHNGNNMFWHYQYTKGGKIAALSDKTINSVTTVSRDNRNLLAVILSTPVEDTAYISDNKNLFEYGLFNFSKGILVSKNQVLGTIDIGQERLNLISSSDIYYTFPVGDDYIKEINKNIKTEIKDTVEKGDILGVITYNLKDGTIIEVPVVAEKTIYINENFFVKKLNEIKSNKELYNLVVFSLIAEAILIGLVIIRLIFYLVKRVSKRSRSAK